MVNTFIVTGSEDSDYTVNATYLDTVRLGKQRVEAQQILNILTDLRTIVGYYKTCSDPPIDLVYDCPEGHDVDSVIDRMNWVTRIRAAYIKRKERLVICVGASGTPTVTAIPIADVKQLITVGKHDSFIDDGATVAVRFAGDKKLSFKYPRRQLIISQYGERIINLGFCSHPVVRMWVGYEDSLRTYINSCIHEYCRRPKKNGDVCSNRMPIYDVPENAPSPWWRGYEGVYLSHRASLLRKESIRNERPWIDSDGTPRMYSTTLLFKSVISGRHRDWNTVGYVWPSNLSYRQIDTIIQGRGRFLGMDDVACPLNN